MKQYIFHSTVDQSNVGTMVVSDDFTIFEIKINPDQQLKYSGAIRRIISTVIKQGSFKAIFATETMNINNGDKLLLQALIQSLLASKIIIPTKMYEVSQILTSD